VAWLPAAQGKAGFGRLWRYNAGEWLFMLIGCIGSFGLGFMMPGMAYCMSTVIAVLYNPDPAQVKSQVGRRAPKQAVQPMRFLRLLRLTCRAAVP
jgi:hypothetical protein